MINVRDLDAGLLHAKLDGMKRQFIRAEGNGTLGVLDAREALFLRSRDNAPVADQAGGRIVKRRVDPQ